MWQPVTPLPRTGDMMKAPLAHYQQELEKLRQVVMLRHWDKLDEQAWELERARAVLQAYLQQHPVDDDLRQELEQLSIKHRRVMRQLSDHIHQTKEDLDHVIDGLKHIHRVQGLQLAS